MSSKQSRALRLVLPVALAVAWAGWLVRPEPETESAAPVAPQPKGPAVAWTKVSPQPSAPTLTALTAPEDPRREEQHAARSATAEPLTHGSLEIVVLDTESALGLEHPVTIKVAASDPSQSTWSEQTELIRSSAQIANMPLGLELSIELRSEALGGSLAIEASGPTDAGVPMALELDLARELRKRNEKAAISTLRSIQAGQQQLQASSTIDTDADGGGEFGYFGELAGSRPMRTYTAQGPAHGEAEDLLPAPFLAAAFGKFNTGNHGGIVQRQGYNYLIYLPGTPDFEGGPVPGLPEASTGGAGQRLPDPSLAEILWCCYAWPIEAHAEHSAAFFINQEGDVLTTSNTFGLVYSGLYAVPAFDAAYSTESPSSMSTAYGIASRNRIANDGNEWEPVL